MFESCSLKDFEELFDMFCLLIGFNGIFLNILGIIFWGNYLEDIEKYKSEDMFLVLSSSGERIERSVAKRKSPRQK